MGVTRPTYVTRERLARALDVSPAAVAAAELDHAITSGSEAVDRLCRRRFYAELDTRTFDRSEPGETPAVQRLWLDDNEILSLVAVTSGGATIDTGDIVGGPTGADSPPYAWLDIDLSSSASWDVGSTWQRAVSVRAWYAGAPDAPETVGALAETLDDSETGVDVTAATAAAVGVGDVLVVGSERMLVTARSWLDTTVNVTLAADYSAQSITGVTIADFADGETLLAGGERMRVQERFGTTVTVERGVDGTTLAAHTAADLYAARTLVVTRGALGTTAAAHSTAVAVARAVYPPLVESLALAEAEVVWLQRRGGYARPQGTGAGARPVPSGTLGDERDRCAAAHRRWLQGAV